MPVATSSTDDPRYGKRRVSAGLTLLVTLMLGACVSSRPMPPDGTIMSRLAPGSPGAAEAAPSGATAAVTPDERRRRYNEVDQQALKDSEQAIRNDQALRAAQANAAQTSFYYGGPAYGGPYYDSVYYGGYYGSGYYPGAWVEPAIFLSWGPAFYGPGWHGGGWGGYGHGGGWHGGGGGWHGDGGGHGGSGWHGGGGRHGGGHH